MVQHSNALDDRRSVGLSDSRLAEEPGELGVGRRTGEGEGELGLDVLSAPCSRLDRLLDDDRDESFGSSGVLELFVRFLKVSDMELVFVLLTSLLLTPLLLTPLLDRKSVV